MNISAHVDQLEPHTLSSLNSYLRSFPALQRSMSEVKQRAASEIWSFTGKQLYHGHLWFA